MNKVFLSILLLCFIVSCTKNENATNNVHTTTAPSDPAFEVNGVKDITFTNWFAVAVPMSLSVIYLDSAQENVKLSVSALPTGLTIDSSWNNNGIPNFSTLLTLYDTTFQGAEPGTYPVTLTAATASGKQKSYSFNIRVLPMSWSFLGKYTNCYTYCPIDTAYTDSIYMDPVIRNKVWFANFSDCGHSIYGFITIPGTITIPNQTYGGYTYHGEASIGPVHAMQFNVSDDCIVTMN